EPALFRDSDTGHFAGRTFVLAGRQPVWLHHLGTLAQATGLRHLASTYSPFAFDSAALALPALHLRLGWADGHQWAAMYPSDAIPSSLRALVRMCRGVGYRLVNDLPFVTASDEAETVARIKLTARGDWYMNGRRIPLRVVFRELRRLQLLGGEVWYHRENPDQDPTPAVWEMARAFMEEASQLQLPIRIFVEDFDQLY
ncbi:MAG: hypothetical protein GYB65_21290, partial [Chloroflexi bacterium]|nr:hypothetical protein [Chloroflexota bacterium]